MAYLPKTGKEPGLDSVKPFGRYGVGILTEHPAGLLVVVAVVLLTLESIPGSRWFLAAALIAGGLFGVLLWLRHR